MTYNIHALHTGVLTELPGSFASAPSRWTWWDDYAIARLGVGDDWEDAACVGGGYFFAVLTTGHIVYRVTASSMAVTSLTSANALNGGDCCYAGGKLYVLWGDVTSGNPMKIERIDAATMVSEATFTVTGSHAGAKPSICTDGTSIYALQDDTPMTVWKIGGITGAMSITSSYVFINAPSNEQGHSIRYDGTNVYGSTVQRTYFRINPATMLPDWIVSPPTLWNGQYYPLQNAHDDIAFDSNYVYLTSATSYKAATDRFDGPRVIDKATGNMVNLLQDPARSSVLGVEVDASNGQVYWGGGNTGSTVNAKHLTDAVRQRVMMTGSAPDDLWWDGTYLWTIEFRIRQSQQPIVSRWSAISGHLGQGRVKALQLGAVTHPNYYQSTLVDSTGCYTGISFGFDALPVGDHMTVLTIQGNSGDIAQVQVESTGDVNFVFNSNAPVKMATAFAAAQHMLELRYDQATGRYRGYLDELPVLDVTLGLGQAVSSVVYGPWDATIDQTLNFTMHTAFDIGMSDTDWVALGRPRWGNVTAVRIGPQLDGGLVDWTRTGETGNARAIDDYADLIAGATGDNGDTSYVDATGTTEAWDSFKLQTFVPLYPRALRVYARAKSTSSPVGTFALGYTDVASPDKSSSWTFGSTQTPTASYVAYVSQFMRNQAGAGFASDAQAVHSFALKKFSSGASQNVRVTQMAVTFLASTNSAVLPWDYPAVAGKATLDMPERGFAQQQIAEAITEAMNTTERGFAVRLILVTSTLTLSAVSGQATTANVILSPILNLSAVLGGATATSTLKVTDVLTVSAVAGAATVSPVTVTVTDVMVLSPVAGVATVGSLPLVVLAVMSLSPPHGVAAVNSIILSPMLQLSAVSGVAIVTLVLTSPTMLALSAVAGVATAANVTITFPGLGGLTLGAVAGVAIVTSTLIVTDVLAISAVRGAAASTAIVQVPAALNLQQIVGAGSIGVTLTAAVLLTPVASGVATVGSVTIILGAVLTLEPVIGVATVAPLTLVSGALTLGLVFGTATATILLRVPIVLLLDDVFGTSSAALNFGVTSNVVVTVLSAQYRTLNDLSATWVPLEPLNARHG